MNEVVVRIESDSGRHRALVVKISERTYRIDVQRLYEGTDAGGVNHGDFWATLNDWTSYTDDLKRAAELAKENLRVSETSA